MNSNQIEFGYKCTKVEPCIFILRYFLDVCHIKKLGTYFLDVKIFNLIFDAVKMLGPITFTKNNENSIYSRNNEIIFSNKKIRRVNYHIHGLRSSNNILVSFGSRFLSVFKLNGDLEKEIIIDTWILDVLIADNIYIGTYKGEVLNIRKEIIFKADLSSISCLTFISPKEILCGAYGFIWAMEKYKIHKGRVFDCCVNKYGFVSSGEERIVFVVDKNGYWVIQELRNYVVKCGIYKNFVYTINKDGTFKVYYKRRLVFVCYSDVLCLSDCLISDDYLFLGYSHGKIRIFEIKMNCKIPVFIEKDLNFFSCSKENGYNLLKIKNIRLNDDENMINEYPVSKDFIIDNIISYSHERSRNFPVYKIPSISIYKIYRRKKIARNISCYCWKNKLEFVDSNGLYNKFLQLPIIPKEILSDDSFVYGYKDRVVFKTVKTTLSNNCTTKLDHHTKKISSTLEFVDQNIFYFNQSKRYLILLCRDKVIYIRKTDMKKYKELHVSSPVISKKNLIGTKYGWIIYKNKGFKIANEPILDLYRKKKYIYCLTSTFIFLFSLKTKTSAIKTHWKIKYQEKNIDILFYDKNTIEIMYRRHFITMKPLKLFKNRVIFSTNAKTTLKDNNLIFCDRNKNLYSIKNLHIGNLPFMAFLNLDNMSILTEFYSFREITVSYVFEEFIVFGTKENKIILCNSFCKILDTLVLNGTISGLHSYENNIYVSTKNGVLYRSTIFKNKLFILAKKETDFRILDIQFSKHLFTVDSGGYLNIYSYDLKFISSFSFYVPLLKIGISCNYLFLSATNGHIFSIRIPRNFKPCIEQKTSKRFLRSRLCKYLVKKETNATYIYSMDTKILCKLKKHKLHENSIFTIAVERDFLVCGGDDHKITILDIKKDVANAKIAHSSSVKDIFIKDDVIYSLSSDSTIKLWDTKLNLLKTIKVSTPKPTVMVACKNFIMVLGNGIEKFPF